MTKQERHILYKRMLIKLRELVKKSCIASFCNTLAFLSGSNNWYYIKELDELMIYKPTVFYDCDGIETEDDSQFWFPVTDTKSRINLLKKVIKETKDEQ